jgi:hypothetical protein
MDLKALDAYLQKALTKVQLYEVYNHYLHYSALSLLQDKKNSSACNDVPSQWEWISN